MEKNNIVFENRVINFKDPKFDPKHEPFYIQDAHSWISDKIDTIYSCTQLFVPLEDRRKGIGSKLLQDYIKENIGDDKLYFVQAGFSKEEYTEEEYENSTIEEHDELFDRLDKFYIKNGFFNINYYIGAYENKVIYLYTNEAAVKLLEKIIEDFEDYKLLDIIIDNNFLSKFTISTKDGIITQETVCEKYDENRRLETTIINNHKTSKLSSYKYFKNNILFTNNIRIIINKNDNVINITRKNGNIINKKYYVII